MRFRDLAAFALSALGQQKVRTILTIIGVTVGTFTLVMSLSVGRGVDNAILSLFRETDALRKIEIRTRFETRPEDVPESDRTPSGPMSDAKRKRLEAALAERFNQGRSSTELAPLIPANVAKIEALAHVESFEPRVSFGGTVELLDSSSAEQPATIASALPASRAYRDRLIAGTGLDSAGPDSSVIHEYLLYRWGFEGDDVSGALGRRIRIHSEFRRSAPPSLLAMLKFSEASLTDTELEALGGLLARFQRLLPLLPVSADERSALTKLYKTMRLTPPKDTLESFDDDFTIVGVVRQSMPGDRDPAALENWQVKTAEVILPTEAAATIYGRTTWARDHGFNQAIVTADNESSVKDLSDALQKLGYHAFSLSQIIDSVRLNILLITFATTFVAIVALVVAALGITNTMIMSVLERTREIGIIKALGARDGQILGIFLIEGVLIGLLGGLLGLGLAYLASFPGDRIARSIMEPQAHAAIPGSIFIFPLWLLLGAPALACVITTLAALYPARRAARVDPITSLRHE
jgi:putative ABC transport system permease protein